MKALEEIYLLPKEDCEMCLGKGYVFTIRPDLNAKKFREVRPCPKCVKQVVRIKEDA